MGNELGNACFLGFSEPARIASRPTAVDYGSRVVSGNLMRMSTAVLLLPYMVCHRNNLTGHGKYYDV